MGDEELAGWPTFAREVDATLAVQSQYVLWGNLYDDFLVRTRDAEPSRLVRLPDLLWEVLSRRGYEFLLVHDPIDGPRVFPSAGPGAEAAGEAARRLLGDLAKPRNVPSLEGLRGYLEAVARPQERVRAAFVFDYASRIVTNHRELQPAERDFFLFCEKLSRSARAVGGDDGTWLYNPVFWLVENEGDLPAWFTAGNHLVRAVGLPFPDLGDRRDTARLLARSFRRDPDADGQAGEACDAFAEQTDGFSLEAMIEVTRLARERGQDFDQLPDAARTYKLGVLDNPWKRDHIRQRIVAGEDTVRNRVLGQEHAVTKTLDILKRAALGLSGAQASKSSARPRGVLFFAGPTGVGKTELAKAVTELVFGDEGAYLRFDMSEFSSEHAGERLIGAPPGFVGFEQGGELTNAVRQQPFRVILFDEIEKAHPRILDKFLQILEDGRLTDGRGTTVYFSESVLVFTSNLGMYVDDGRGGRVPNVTPDMAREERDRRVRGAIRDHFTLELNRPELLNRFGDNIVVFDSIDAGVAAGIFELLLGNITGRLDEEHGVELKIDDDVLAQLRAWCTADLDNGGRGIGTALESYFVNPLARALFDHPFTAGEAVRVTDIRSDGDTVSLELA